MTTRVDSSNHNATYPLSNERLASYSTLELVNEVIKRINLGQNQKGVYSLSLALLSEIKPCQEIAGILTLPLEIFNLIFSYVPHQDQTISKQWLQAYHQAHAQQVIERINHVKDWLIKEIKEIPVAVNSDRHVKILQASENLSLLKVKAISNIFEAKKCLKDVLKDIENILTNLHHSDLQRIIDKLQYMVYTPYNPILWGYITPKWGESRPNEQAETYVERFSEFGDEIPSMKLILLRCCAMSFYNHLSKYHHQTETITDIQTIGFKFATDQIKMMAKLDPDKAGWMIMETSVLKQHHYPSMTFIKWFYNFSAANAAPESSKIPFSIIKSTQIRDRFIVYLIFEELDERNEYTAFTIEGLIEMAQYIHDQISKEKALIHIAVFLFAISRKEEDIETVRQIKNHLSHTGLDQFYAKLASHPKISLKQKTSWALKIASPANRDLAIKRILAGSLELEDLDMIVILLHHATVLPSFSELITNFILTHYENLPNLSLLTAFIKDERWKHSVETILKGKNKADS